MYGNVEHGGAVIGGLLGSLQAAINQYVRNIPPNDEFNLTSISNMWTQSYQVDGHGSEGGGVLTLTAGQGTVWEENWQPSGIYQNIEAGRDFDIRIYVPSAGSIPVGVGIGFALTFYIDATHYMGIMGGPTYRWFYVYPGSGALSGGSLSLNAPIYLRIVRSGSNLTCYYSTNGVSWTQLGNTFATGSGTGQIWLTCNKGAGVSYTANFDWFRDLAFSQCPRLTGNLGRKFHLNIKSIPIFTASGAIKQLLHMRKMMSGSLRFAGTLSKVYSVGRFVTGSFHCSATLIKAIRRYRFPSGALRFAGTLNLFSGWFKGQRSLSGRMTMTGKLYVLTETMYYQTVNPWPL